ncbi:MAG: hemerythrin family protein [Magnetococcales bacterium]|nr:hemerythrin family protein [Magnetococcales bacterium]
MSVAKEPHPPKSPGDLTRAWMTASTPLTGGDMSDPVSIPTQWNPAYSIGIVEIDQQHMDLMRHVDTMQDLLAHPKVNHHTIRKTLRTFIDHVKSHFQFEEEFMFLLGYEHYHSHKETHKFLLLQLKRLVEDNQDQVNGARRIIKFLHNWLVGHMAVDDRGYASLITQISAEDYRLFLEQLRHKQDQERPEEEA